MSNITREYRERLAKLRRAAFFRGGDEKTILMGWAGLFEHHCNRLGSGTLPAGDMALTVEALDKAMGDSGKHLRDIETLKIPPHYTAEQMEATKARYAAIVADAPWALPGAVKPKGQWGGKR
jgi:hypothetical protein